MFPGIPAALFPAVIKTLLKANFSSGHPMERMMAGVSPSFSARSSLIQ